MKTNTTIIDATNAHTDALVGKINNKVPQFLQDSLVNDVTTVEEFWSKYCKPERYTGRGEEYVKSILKYAREEINERGYTSISRHSSVTGKFVTFCPTA